MEDLLVVERELDGGATPAAQVAAAAAAPQPFHASQKKQGSIKGSLKKLFSKKSKVANGVDATGGDGGANNGVRAGPDAGADACNTCVAAAVEEEPAPAGWSTSLGQQEVVEVQQQVWQLQHRAEQAQQVEQQEQDQEHAEPPEGGCQATKQQAIQQQPLPSPLRQQQHWHRGPGADIGTGDDGDEANSVRYDRQGYGNDGSSVAGGRDSRMSTFGGSNMGTLKGLLGPRGKKTKQIELDALR